MNTPEQITELKENEIFVFGSNMNGNHAGGAAKTAVDKFGAIEGQAIGLQGQSYGLPTLSKKMQKLALSIIKKHLSDLNAFAQQNNNLTFYVTKIGCGIAGYDIKDIAELFHSIEWNGNIILPLEFLKIEQEQIIKGFKAYEKGMICKGFQYEEGETYEHKGELVCCPNSKDIEKGAGGFHFCQDPLDVLDYYSLIDNDCNILEFSEVEGLGESKKDRNKICTRKIKIGGKLSLKSFTDLSLKFLFESVKISETSSGRSAQLASSGDYAKLASSGKNSIIAAIGKENIAKGCVGTWITLAEYACRIR